MVVCQLTIYVISEIDEQVFSLGEVMYQGKGMVELTSYSTRDNKLDGIALLLSL